MRKVSMYEQSYAGESSVALVRFVKMTYVFLAASLLFATLGAAIGLSVAPISKGAFFIAVIVEFILLFSLRAVRNTKGLNIAVFFFFTALTGFTLTPLLHFTLGKAGGEMIIVNALLMTTVTFGAMSMFALSTKRNLANMGRALFFALIAIILVSLVNIFFFKSPVAHLVISGISAIIFSLLIAYDTQNIVRGLYDSPISAAISMYLNILNLFISLLNILNASRD